VFRFFLLFFIFLPTLVSAQKKIGKPFVQAYPATLYGSAVQNWGIGQDERGIMYFANDQGVLEYDGRNWRLFTLPNHEPVRSIRVAEKGVVYIGGVGEFGYLSPNNKGMLEYRSLKHLLPDSIKFEDVWSIQTSKQYIYFQTDSYIFGYEPATQKNIKVWKPHAPDVDFFLTFLIHDKLFVHSRKAGLLTLENGIWQISTIGASFAGSRIYVMLPLSAHQTLIASREKGLFLYEHGTTGKVSIEKWECEADDFIMKNQIYSGAVLGQNRVILCTRKAGAIEIDYNGKIIEVFDKNAGLTDENVRAAYLSQDNILWFALDNGINHISYRVPIRLWDSTRGIRGTVRDVQEFDGQIYLTTSLGLFVLDKNTDSFEALQGISNVESWTFEVFTINGINKLLAGTNEGVFEIQGRQATLIYPSKKAIRSLKQASYLPNRLYVGQKGGLASLEFRQGSWVDEGAFENITQEIISLLESPDSPTELWAGTFTEGTYRISLDKNSRKTRLTPYRQKEGLPALRDSRLYSWKNTIGVACPKGLYLYDKEQDKFIVNPIWEKRFPQERGVYTLVIDSQKNIWVADHDTRKNSIGAFFPTKDGEYIWHEDAMRRLPEFSETKLYVDKHQTLWIGGTDGLYRYHTQEKKGVPKILQALIREIKTQGDSTVFGGFSKQDRDKMPVFEYDAGFEISFHCAAPFYDVEKRTEFSFFLERYDKPLWGGKYKDAQWSSWTRENKRTYNNLFEGTYTFHVKARNVYGEESIIASYHFRISPPWYRSLVAYLLYIVLASVVVYLITTYYTHSLRMQKERLEEIVTERTSELVESSKKLELAHHLLVKHNTDLNDSIEYASRIQHAMLPKKDDIKRAFPDSFIFWKPLQKVSGDFYWFAETPTEPRYAKDPHIEKGKVSIFKGFVEGKKIIAAIDCTGHGIPGAFMSMMGDAYLEQIVNTEGVTQPQLILQELDTLIRHALKQDESDNADGMDMAIAVVNPNLNVIEFAGAKNGLIYVKGGEAQLIRGDRFGIGGVHFDEEQKLFTRHVIPIEDCTTFYLYSDGLPDQFGGEKAKKFSTKQMQAFFAEHTDKNMQEQGQLLEQTVATWMADYEQIDDILVIGVRVRQDT
jgi:serine phosphatase RsbU (regulator of sigma subunit)/ligand-binding sensor domain-containing protein